MKILDFLETHPQLCGFLLALLVPLVMSIVNAALRPRTPEEYAALPKRLAAFLKLLRAVFPDPQKAAIAAGQIVRASAMSPIVKRAMDHVDAVRIEEAAQDASTIPVPPKEESK